MQLQRNLKLCQLNKDHYYNSHQAPNYVQRSYISQNILTICCGCGSVPVIFLFRMYYSFHISLLKGFLAITFLLLGISS